MLQNLKTQIGLEALNGNTVSVSQILFKFWSAHCFVRSIAAHVMAAMLVSVLFLIKHG